MSESFGKEIYARRTEIGMSQGRLAELVGRSTSTVRAWEKGKTSPSPASLDALRAILGLSDHDEETVMEAVLDSGGEDIRDEESTLEVITPPEDFEAVRKALDERNVHYLLAELTLVPKSTVKLEDKEAEQMLRLMDGLEAGAAGSRVP